MQRELITTFFSFVLIGILIDLFFLSYSASLHLYCFDIVKTMLNACLLRAAEYEFLILHFVLDVLLFCSINNEPFLLIDGPLEMKPNLIEAQHC
ncbi:hypothetical protein T4D_1252 [Trichinella pseudospiralis]|uniref:Uncharacterized protein n=1 Tax=Trichinella pseudospiralis TaxID=6337 RepID=A0A0V1FJG4_TRIPS|nr:hypothetical protein T4D_1252 [Trichinella pseudospiralis]